MFVSVREKASGQKCTERDDVAGCFGCIHPLVDGSLQLFGRAPMAAFNGDAAQNREKERRHWGERRSASLNKIILRNVALLI